MSCAHVYGVVSFVQQATSRCVVADKSSVTNRAMIAGVIFRSNLFYSKKITNDRYITKRLLNAITPLKLVPTNQFGSIIGGTSTSPIDIMLMISEDAHFHNRTAWVNLLDCSEAFDSMNDPITDIILAHTGLPDKFILWTRRAHKTKNDLF